MPKWKKKENPQVELSEVNKKNGYDVLAALAKALLVFMLSYGAVGGFLSAYDLSYNHTVCVAVLLGLALLLSFIYETEIKWFTNLCVIGVFLIYAYVAMTRFWLFNSGAYTVINAMYEQAQNYLGIVGGALYNLDETDPYRAITAIAIFMGVVLDVLFVLRLQYKASLVRTVLLTFTIYLVPLYFECTPDAFYLFLLLAGYVTMGILQFGKVRRHISGQIKQALPVGAAIAAVVVFFWGMIWPRQRYYVPKNASKAQSEIGAVNYAQYGVMALFMNRNVGAGLNKGRLSQNVTLLPDYESDLLVRFTPYSMEPVYLKAFTGLSYNGSQWSDAAQEIGFSEGSLTDVAYGRKELYEKDTKKQSRGIMEVISLDEDLVDEFRPYYTEPDSVQWIQDQRAAGRAMRYAYYPVVSAARVPDMQNKKVSEKYLEVPAICREAVRKSCLEAGLSGTPEEIARQIDQYFREKYAYTLRPGYYFGGMDYISYFLAKNKKGVCTHFASAGTMLFRYMGIPARYVEGYVFSYTDVVTDGVLREDLAYEDYYDGYAPLGKTALVEVEIPDSQAHAWIEIYLEDKGWTVVDVTPPSSMDEEETTSFWDAFLNGGGQNGGDGQQAGEASDYLENVLAGGAGVFGAFLAIVSLILLGRWGYGKYREWKLPDLQRLQLEYGRLTGPLKAKNEEFARLTTPAEELDWIKGHYAVEMSDDLKEQLYHSFFAPQEGHDYEKLRRTLIRMRKKCR